MCDLGITKQHSNNMYKHYTNGIQKEVRGLIALKPEPLPVEPSGVPGQRTTTASTGTAKEHSHKQKDLFDSVSLTCSIAKMLCHAIYKLYFGSFSNHWL